LPKHSAVVSIDSDDPIVARQKHAARDD
jgi:hypothetical protein